MKHGGNVWDSGKPSEWLDFSANLRPEGPPEWVRRVLQDSLENVRFYPDRAMRAARAGLAAYLGVPEAHILPAAGGAAAIDLALSLRTGRVLTRPVTFGEYRERAEQHGRPVLTGTDSFLSGDTLVICNPNNPTGEALSRAEMLEKHRAAANSGAELLADEAFIDFCPECSVRGCVSGSLTVVGSLTKLLGIPGVRLGYVCGTEQNISLLEKRMVTWSLNAFAAAVAAELPAHQAEIALDIRTNTERKKRLTAGLEGLGASVCPSRANFVLADFGRDMNGAADFLRQRGILVRTCSSFGLDSGWLRLAVRLEHENDRLIRELGLWLAR